MLPVMSMLLLAFAVSLDGFGVGVTYGLRKIRIPLHSIAIISLCSGAVIYLSMQAGVWLSRYVSPEWGKLIGSLILIGIGIWAVRQMLASRRDEEAAMPGPCVPKQAEEAGGAGAVREVQEPKPSESLMSLPGSSLHPEASGQAGLKPPSAREVLSIELKRFGLVIQILRTPSIADFDRSGNISPYEAMLLGLALSLDAFGAGLGAALLGFSPWLTSGMIALASGMFLTIGLRIGYRYADGAWMRKLSVVPGIVLIVMGVMKLF